MGKGKRLQEYGKPSGSPGVGEPLFLAVGRLLRSHGLHGEMLMEVLTDFPERLGPENTFYIGEQHLPIKILSRRGHQNGFLVAFEGIENPEMTVSLRNQYLYVSADDRPPLPEGEYYHHQLLGLKVVSDQGQEMGQLAGILETGANDVYIVRSEAKAEILLPNISSVVLKIDLEKGEMHVHLIPGLLPE